ncbi:MAG: hypothetical protein EPN85_02530 [Bacteroidetes bacterium]|nr:MAG: hypothetical protein EPN85_02530 [Bacteroidota bacterium]
MTFPMKLSFSTLAISVVAFVCLLIDFSLKNWEKEDRVIEWDVHSYYEYLPAYFIYDDIKFEKSDYHLGDNRFLFWPVFTEDGRKVIKMSMGTAFFYAPFFFAAHAYASVTDYPEDGFSEPYKIFLLLSTIFYLIIGLDFLRKFLTKLDFSDRIIAVVILLIGLGTNMLCYASHSAPMSHIYSFCVFCLFIYCTMKWHESPAFLNTLAIGFLLGIISLIRPTNAVIVLFFIFYGITTFSGLKERIRFFLKKYLLMILISFCVFLVWIPQFIYWKTATGHFLAYPYGDEGFFFSHPRILEGLFSWRKGWLVYTPMMAFALAGIFFLKGDLKKFRLPILVFMAVNIYIIFSWWCWWYGGTHGQRSFIESYGLLAIPFASFIKFLSEKKWYFNLPFYLVAVFFIWLNIFQIYQFEIHSLHYDGMTKELYFKQFGKMAQVKDFDNMVSYPNYDEAGKGNDCEAAGSANTGIDNKAWQAYNRTEVSRKTIQLKAANGKYVCADEAANNIVIANRDTALGWETFTLLLFEKNECAVRAANGQFFCAELNLQSQVTASRNNIGNWETFSLEQLDSNYAAFKAANGKYLSVDERSSQLFALGETIGDREKFEIIRR